MCDMENKIRYINHEGKVIYITGATDTHCCKCQQKLKLADNKYSCHVTGRQIADDKRSLGCRVEEP